MTDAVGGVDVDVAEPFVGAHHQFTAGTNHLDGDAALAFVRERHSLPRGDFDRIQHQQQFLKALMAKTTSHGELTDPVGLTRLLDAVTRSVSVDSELSGGDLRSLAFSVRTLRGGAVKTLTVPNAGTGRVGAASVVFLDAARDRVVFAAVREDRVASITP
jgi:anionic cell wall polymer biosynthesis LytR-Cps2A-Psr (LCP) family protein